MMIRPRRSVLYMPGSNARALEKARNLPADALILDLEDAVAPDAKEEARELVVCAVKNGGYGRRELVIRINALSTEWGAQDLAAAIEAEPDAILVPKVNYADDIAAVAAEVNGRGARRDIRLWAMIETPLATLNAADIAAKGADPNNRLNCFVMGTNDLAKETRVQITRERLPMLAWLSICVAAARAHGLDIIDGVYNDFRDEDGFAAECAQARAFGFDGKTLIHPSQIAPANGAFSPSPDEIEGAAKIIAAFENPDNRSRGAISIDGRMVERLHLEMARRTTALAEAIAASGNA